MSGGRCWLAATALLGLLAVLAGCSGGFFFFEREAWRREAEAACLNSGAVTEGSGIVRISAITGPGMCGADFPLRVSVLGEGGALGFADDPRPPGAIPGAPSWPIAKPANAPARQTAPAYPGPYPATGATPRAAAPEAPLSLHPPGLVQPPTPAQPYDYRSPYGGAARDPALPASYQSRRSPGSPREDLSPVPYERRRLIEDEGGPSRNSPVTRAPLREIGRAEETPRRSGREAPADEDHYEPVRRPVVPPLVPMGAARGEPPSTSAPTPVAVNPPATLACPIVSELDRWIAGAVQPAALRWFGSPVVEIKQISAYSCRGMNGNPGARISEHAFGNALDIAAFTLADGRTITVKNGWHGAPQEQGFLRDVQGAACDQFTTVLAPGSNAYHYDHIHVDLMRRASDYRICSPQAVPGDEVAARAGWKVARRRGSDPFATGALSAHRPPRPQKHVGADEKDDRFPDRALPLARPGEDGAD
jgi:Extensin-like protein C-terminus